MRVALLACALTAAACATPDSPTIGTISAAGISGVWRLQILQRAGQGALLVPSGTTYTLTLADDAVSVHADCNICNGTFRVVGDTLNIGPLGCTRAACVTQTFETSYETLLAGENQIEVIGTRMFLTSSRGLLQFTR